MDILDLREKIAVVTGSSGGIGFGIANHLARAGATVFVNGRTPESVEAAFRLFPHSADMRPLIGDAADERFVKSAVEGIIACCQKIDILVNNVGLYKKQGVEQLDATGIHEIMAANVYSALFWIREVVPHMKKNASGKIISVASVAGMSGRQDSAPYNVAKGGIIALTKGLAKDLGPFNIQVNAIAPGLIPTKLVSDLPESVFENNKKKTPLGRLGTPDDIGKAALFLTSSLSDFITGQTIVVDGGYSL